ncbi:MAG TPA: hypothetical protein VHG28_05670, partial [Longimicrobiaceae bacterium]|nr:hypothetical protein [Longimicrobiaceae bacterium]
MDGNGTSHAEAQTPLAAGEDRPSRRRTDSRRSVRIAAVGDFHCGEQDVGAYRPLFARANEEADILVLCGDLTRWGTAA